MPVQRHIVTQFDEILVAQNCFIIPLEMMNDMYQL
jgi:hypothetical protein